MNAKPNRGLNYQRIQVTHFGGPNVMKMTTGDLLETRDHDVRVRILAAGVSFADILMREGIHPEAWFRFPPFTPGWDIVGRVDKTGRRVKGFEHGQLVAALPVTGGYAEYIHMPEWELVPLPAYVDPFEALCLVLNYTTAYQMIHRIAKCKPGEKVIIYNAAGGVGTALLQLGNMIRLKMYGTSSDQKQEIVVANGGKPLRYSAGRNLNKLPDELADGVDVVFDGLGGDSLNQSYKFLRSGGRLVAYGLSGALNPGRSKPIRNMRSIAGWLGAFSKNISFDQRRVLLYRIQTYERIHPLAFQQDLAHLLELLEDGKIKPIIAQKAPLEKAADLHKMLASGTITGKLILTNRDGTLQVNDPV